MPSKTKILLVALLSIFGCQAPEADPEPAPQAPEAIGPELIGIVGAWSWCGGGLHLYRDGRKMQLQCFDGDGDFSYENRGELTLEAATMLDDELAAADLDDTEPVNYMGFCGNPDVIGTETIWIGDASVSFENSCPIHGVVSLYEYLDAIWVELSNCGMYSLVPLFESIDPECMLYPPDWDQ